LHDANDNLVGAVNVLIDVQVADATEGRSS
jgi:hypothetical protein